MDFIYKYKYSTKTGLNLPFPVWTELSLKNTANSFLWTLQGPLFLPIWTEPDTLYSLHLLFVSLECTVQGVDKHLGNKKKSVSFSLSICLFLWNVCFWGYGPLYEWKMSPLGERLCDRWIGWLTDLRMIPAVRAILLGTEEFYSIHVLIPTSSLNQKAPVF